MSGFVCLFQNSNYDGIWVRYSGNDSNYAGNTFNDCYSFNCLLNDSVSSIDNDGRSLGTRHFVNYYGTSPNPSFYIKRGGYMATLNSTFQDDLSAHRWE